MKISELIQYLQDVQKETGDVEVYGPLRHDESYEICPARVETEPVFVYVRAIPKGRYDGGFRTFDYSIADDCNAIVLNVV